MAGSAGNVTDAAHLEHRRIDDLEILIAGMARHQAHHYQCSLAAATHQICALVAKARADYRAAVALYGDDDRDFCRWLLARPRLRRAVSSEVLGTLMR